MSDWARIGTDILTVKSRFFPLYYTARIICIWIRWGDQSVRDQWGSPRGAEVIVFCVALAEPEKVEGRHWKVGLRRNKNFPTVPLSDHSVSFHTYQWVPQRWASSCRGLANIRLSLLQWRVNSVTSKVPSNSVLPLLQMCKMSFYFLWKLFAYLG